MLNVVIYIGGFLFLMTYLASQGGLANQGFVRDTLKLEQQDAAVVETNIEARKKSVQREIRTLENELDALTEADER